MREYASSTIIPACLVVVEISNGAKVLIDKEVSAFFRSPDNSLYMLPSIPQVICILFSLWPMDIAGNQLCHVII